MKRVKSFTEFVLESRLMEEDTAKTDAIAAKREYNDILTKMGLDITDKESLQHVADKVEEFLKDPENRKNFTKGLEDGNAPLDDQINVKTVTIDAKALSPSQRAIYLDQSIVGFISRPVSKYLKPILDGKFEASDIFISADDYIIDGHHRWSAIMALNPDTKMTVTKINLPILAAIPILNAILKATETGAKSMGGTEKQNIWNGLDDAKEYQKNIIEILKEAVKVDKNIPEKNLFKAQEEFYSPDGSLDKFIKYINGGGIDVKDEQSLAEYMYKNIDSIPKAEKIFPPRQQMPQMPDDKKDTEEVLTDLSKGKFDIKKGESPTGGLHKAR
jgi:hypothetical protein